MKTISKSKGSIREAMREEMGDIADDYTDDDLAGYLIQQDDDGNRMITKPAPDDEPRSYNVSTNTGGRRFVCWA